MNSNSAVFDFGVVQAMRSSTLKPSRFDGELPPGVQIPVEVQAEYPPGFNPAPAAAVIFGAMIVASLLITLALSSCN